MLQRTVLLIGSYIRAPVLHTQHSWHWPLPSQAQEKNLCHCSSHCSRLKLAQHVAQHMSHEIKGGVRLGGLCIGVFSTALRYLLHPERAEAALVCGQRVLMSDRRTDFLYCSWATSLYPSLCAARCGRAAHVAMAFTRNAQNSDLHPNFVRQK